MEGSAIARTPAADGSKAIEAAIRAAATFFAAILGFGLKDLLGKESGFNTGKDFYGIHLDAMLAFLVAATLFARFIIGAATYLTLEFVDHKESRPKHLILDFAFLSLYALVGVMMAHAKSASQLFLFAAIFCGLAFVWFVVDRGLQELEEWWAKRLNGGTQPVSVDGKQVGNWNHFLKLNAVCFAGYGALAYLSSSTNYEWVPLKVPVADSTTMLLLGAVCSMAVLAIDLACQLKVLDEVRRASRDVLKAAQAKETVADPLMQSAQDAAKKVYETVNTAALEAAKKVYAAEASKAQEEALEKAAESVAAKPPSAAG